MAVIAQEQIKPGYKHTEVGVIPAEWETTTFGRIAIYVGSGKSKVAALNGTYPVYGSTGVIGYNESSDYSGNAILVARVGANAGKLRSCNKTYPVARCVVA
jgi:type I restriction enzyme S subunit